jgi:equilibrative nucleoside transporter 1/2/3
MEIKEAGETEIEKPEGGLKMRICFIIFGIGSLLAWNAILSDIGFFIYYQGKYKPSTSFAFFNFALNIVFQFIMIFKKQLITYKTQLIFGLIASIISLVALPFTVAPFEKDSLTSFILTGGIILFQGLVNAFCCSGFFGLTSFFPMEMIISLSSGQGISGILMNVIGFIVIASTDQDDPKIGAIIFFSISGLIILICLIILLFAFKSDYFKYYLGKTGEYNKMQNKIENKVSEGAIVSRVTVEKEGDEQLVESQNENKEKSEISFFDLFKMLYDVDLLSCYIYVITFALFPGCSINQRLFHTGNYRQTAIVTIYNVFDTVGRSIISKIKPTKILTYIIVLGRTILLFTLIFNFYLDMNEIIGQDLSSIFVIINVSILALTNGMATSLCFGLAPSLVPDEIKGRAGGSISFFNIFGIFLGTCVAFLTNYIMGEIGVYNGD